MTLSRAFVLVLFFASGGLAALSELQTYLERYFPVCPGGTVKFEQVGGGGPQGFIPYRVRFSSSEKYCGRETFALVSPTTKQILIADVFPLPKDMRRVELRLAELGERQLKKPVRVDLSPVALEDGLREVMITVDGREGAFNFRGYLDASQSYLIVGRRGKVNADPRKELLTAVTAHSPVRRGKQNATVSIVELSDFQCPTCKHAHDMLDPLIRKNLGRLSYTRLDLPIFEGHDWSLSAALAARAIQRVSPQHYWKFVDYVFENQALIKREVVDNFVQDFVESQSIDWKKFSAIYKSPAERKTMVDEVERLFEAGIFATPTYIVNGREIYYGKEGAHLKQYLETLLKK